MKSRNLLAAFGLSALCAVSSTAFSQTFYQLGYESQPAKVPSNVIVLTFDDGVDLVNTPRILDTLREKGVKATFFINANNITGQDDAGVADVINRIINEGHELANHTNHHYSLPSLSEGEIENEIVSVEDFVSSATGGRITKLPLIRAPFGEGFQGGINQDVAKVVARHGVQVGWNFDSFDYACGQDDAQCVVNGFMGPLDQGAYGVSLMHSIHPQTAAAIGTIIDQVRSRGYIFWSTEQMVKAEFGMSSFELVYGNVGPVIQPTQPTQPTKPTQPSNPGSGGSCSGVAEYQETSRYSIGDKVVRNGKLYENINENAPTYTGPGAAWFWKELGTCN